MNWEQINCIRRALRMILEPYFNLPTMRTFASFDIGHFREARSETNACMVEASRSGNSLWVEYFQVQALHDSLKSKSLSFTRSSSIKAALPLRKRLKCSFRRSPKLLLRSSISDFRFLHSFLASLPSMVS